MKEDLTRLRVLLGEAWDLEMIRSLLQWDQATYMPDGGAAARGRQLALIGLGLWIAGFIIPMLGILTFLGIAALVVAGLSLLIRPRTQEKYWRGRRIDLDGEPGWGERLYRTIYRR